MSLVRRPGDSLLNPKGSQLSKILKRVDKTMGCVSPAPSSGLRRRSAHIVQSVHRIMLILSSDPERFRGEGGQDSIHSIFPHAVSSG